MMSARRRLLAQVLAASVCVTAASPAVLTSLAVRAPGVATAGPAAEPTASRPIAVVPFDLYDGRVFLRVHVDGEGPGDFQFDSAAGRSCVSQRFAGRIGLQAPLTATVRGAGDGQQTVSLAPGVSFTVGPLAYRSERVPLVDFDELDRFSGRHTDGLVGREFLARYVVAIDPTSRTLTAYEPKSFAYHGRGTAFPVEIAVGGPVLKALVRMPGRPPLGARILLDAPHAGPVVLTTPFVDRHQLLEPAQQLTPKLVAAGLMGVGGESAQLLGRALALEIGPYAFASPVVFFSRAKAGTLAASEIDGLIGSQILNRFRVFYDCPHGRVILEPGPRLAEPLPHDMSGLRLRAQTVALESIEVVRVAEGSPAAAAGVEAGDLLLSIDGRPARPTEFPEVRARFEQAGPVRLELLRGAVKKTVTLELRPRI
jgi:PDZ domain/Aspartyl protease